MSDVKNYDLVVLGAGASGLFCAFNAARSGLKVLLLEKANKVGKKILMSGGGRCNFTNYYVEPENFLCQNPHFVKSALSQYSQWDFISMVSDHNIAYEEREHGQLFCLDSAKDILNMLLRECELAGVKIKTHSQLEQLSELRLKGSSDKHQPQDKRPRYQLTLTDANKYHCRSVVVATGALSIPSLGGSGYGYQIAEQFGLELLPRRAGLVPFMFSDQIKILCDNLSGLALPVSISCNKQSFSEAMLFTHRGISGPAVLQISSYWNPGDSISIDLLPNTQAPQWLLECKRNNSKSLLRSQLSKHFAKPLCLELQQLWWPQSADKPLAEFSDKELLLIAEKLNNWQLKPSATEGYRTAEVTLGGVNTDAISSKTMQAKNQPGLYFIGEVLDVSGHLGGFNFQWAWSSGYAAAKAITEN